MNNTHSGSQQFNGKYLGIGNAIANFSMRSGLETPSNTNNILERSLRSNGS